MPLADLKPQSPINIRADAYGQTALNLSRLAAMTTRCKLDIAYGSGAAQRLDVYMPADKSAKGLPVFIKFRWRRTHGYKEWMGLNAPANAARFHRAVRVSIAAPKLQQDRCRRTVLQEHPG